MIYIVDVDGTVADISHRLHFIDASQAKHVDQAKNPTKDWEGFFAAAVDDKPIFEVIAVVRALYNQGHTIAISTGRPSNSNHSAGTVKWLQKYRVNNHGVFMREAGDHREDYVVKEELLDQIIARFPGQALGGAFEDREQVVAMYRKRGLRVFQVAEGKF